jgi:thiamine biosynthesis protein ThiI
MSHVVIVHYNEIGLKGRNQPLFLRRLEANLVRATSGTGVRRVDERSGRLALALSGDADWSAIRERVRCVFGVANFSFAARSDLDLESLKTAMDGELQGRTFASFKVATRRAYKPFPLTSEDVNRELGAHVVARTGARVDLERPEVVIHIEVLPRDIFFSFGREAGPGGLPVGVSGNVVALLSGGIDSPVAAHRVIKRGCRAAFIHFHSAPFQDATSQAKAADLARCLTRFQYHSRLYVVPFGEVQRQIVASAPAPLRVVLYRRFMIRIAAEIARREGAKALVTGESLGQVASQTLENLAVIDDSVRMPILRPLIGSDKEEIVQQARALGSYEISILPDQDCCSLFASRHPATFSTFEEIWQAESRLSVAELVQTAVERLEIQAFEFPDVAPRNIAVAAVASGP